MAEFEVAKDKVLMGTERRSMIISDEEKRNTAYHEAGHALVASLIPGTDPIHKVSIIPRGMALGVTQQLPIDEKHNYAKVYLINNLAILLGGRVAEEVALGHITTGAGNDLERATTLARKMVCEWGMSEKLGPITFGKREELIFLGREVTQQQDYSESTAEEIDREVKSLVVESYNRSKELISENKDKLEAMADALLERESLDGDEIQMILRGEELPPKLNGDRESEEDDQQTSFVFTEGEGDAEAEGEAAEEETSGEPAAAEAGDESGIPASEEESAIQEPSQSDKAES